MKNILACALGILAFAAWSAPCRADGCCGAPGTKSIAAASCCDTCDDCGKPSCRDRLKACFKKKDDCCEAPKCEAPKCAAPKCEAPKCDDCAKPSCLERLRARKHKNDCCDCGTAAPPLAAPALKAEPIPAPKAMPKDGDKKEE